MYIFANEIISPEKKILAEGIKTIISNLKQLLVCKLFDSGIRFKSYKPIFYHDKWINIKSQ